MPHKRKMKNWIIITLYPTLPLLGRQEFQEDKGQSQKKAGSQRRWRWEDSLSHCLTREDNALRKPGKASMLALWPAGKLGWTGKEI